MYLLARDYDGNGSLCGGRSRPGRRRCGLVSIGIRWCSGYIRKLEAEIGEMLPAT